MVDRDRILAKLDQLEGYLGELRAVAPARFEQYRSIEKRRACERLLQVMIEAVIDVCGMLVSGLRLGLPGDEDDVLDKLEQHGVFAGDAVQALRRMKGMRNILVHGYAHVSDELVFETVSHRLGDFAGFRRDVLTYLGGPGR